MQRYRSTLSCEKRRRTPAAWLIRFHIEQRYDADNKRRRTGLEVFICVRTRASLKSCQTVIMIGARVCTSQWGHPLALLRGVVMLLLDNWLENVLAKSKRLATGVRIIQNPELNNLGLQNSELPNATSAI